MTNFKRNTMAMAVAVAAVFAAAATAQTATPQPAEQKPATEAKRVIVVSLEDRKLALVEDGQVKRVYTVAVGKPSTPSPTGTFTVESHVMNPTYSHDGRIVPPGPNNPVGSRWMGLSIKGYGIHGTNVQSSIGKAASHGCIRMAKADLEEVFPMIHVGDTVELIGQRNEETAQLFGTQPAVAPAQSAPVEAKQAPAPAPTQQTAAAVKADASQAAAINPAATL